LKRVSALPRLCLVTSPPMRGRGLKLAEQERACPYRLSPPMRGRGLKHRGVEGTVMTGCRPPCGGVD